MSFDRRSLIAGLAAAWVAPRGVRAAAVTDAAGRAVAIPDRVARVFPAGPPAAILLYTLAPELLLGWPRANRPEECEYMLPDICTRPEVGRITGRGNTANLEVVLALKPDLILDIGSTRGTFVSLADRVQQQTGIPYALLDGRFDATVATYRKLGELIHRQAVAELHARYAEETMATIRQRIEAIPQARRPRVYYARGPRGLETGLGGSINVETIEFVGARNVAAAPGRPGNRLDRAGAGRNPDVIVTIDRDFAANVRSDPVWAPVAGGAQRPGASVAQAAVRLGRLPAVGQPADRIVVAREDSLSGAIPGGPARADARLLHPLLSRDAERRADRAGLGRPGLIWFSACGTFDVIAGRARLCQHCRDHRDSRP